MIRTAIVGYGLAGRLFHAYLVSRTQGLELVAVASRDPVRRAQAEQDWSVDTRETLTDLLADDRIELIILATPHDSHAALAIEAMEARRHVVVDKVMCMNAAEAEDMISVSRRREVMLSVFHNRRWDWGYLTVRKAVEDGLLGDPFLVERAVHRFRASRGWRTSRAKSGGLLYDWGAHLIDQGLQLLAARPAAVHCTGHKHRWEGDIEDHVTCTLHFENGAEYRIEISNLSPISKPHWYVLGTRGALVKTGLDPQEDWMKKGEIESAVEAPENRVRIAAERDGEITEWTLDPVKGSWVDYYRNVAAVLECGGELAVKPGEMLDLMKVLDAATASLESGRVESIS
ncbi:MAG: Gfo/Idh/MocA family oxidoreductase [Gemmatimonadetes bacterium]|nr:Gfo/Idh/MocA family oxidoreductase [Gemmatimonadota bacterium]